MKLLKKPICIIIYGAQASGKGTQAEKIVHNLNLKLITTGNLLRNAQNKKNTLAKKIKQAVTKGQLVDDEIIAKLLFDEINSSKNKNGFLIDCFPRNNGQIKYFQDIIKKNNFKKIIALYLEIKKQTSIDRIVNRKICIKCQTPYGPMHSSYKKDICSKCHGKLIKRSDDTPKALKTRLNAYYKDTLPVIKYFQEKYDLIKVNGEPKINKVTAEIFYQLKNKGVI